MNKTNPNSHLTAIVRNKISFPARKLKEANLLKGRILDFGSGFGQDVDFLKTAGFEIEGYDPHYQAQFPKGKFDTILCLYVLNVIFKEEQSRVIWQLSQLLKKGGSAYFAVRRDLKREGFRHHHIHQVETYQSMVKLPFESWLKAKHCEIYQYKCFADLNPERFGNKFAFVGETACCLAFEKEAYYYLYPKRQVESFEQLNSHEQAAMHWLKNHLNADFKGELPAEDYAWILSKTT